MDGARLERLVRQHAETSRLLGVDFVPVYRRPAPPPEEEPEPPVVASRPVGFTPARAAGGRAPAEVQSRLDELRARYEREAPHRQFVTAHSKIVFGEGDPCARLMFIGEAPGAEE